MRPLPNASARFAPFMGGQKVGETVAERLARIERAFQKEGFLPVAHRLKDERLGVAAEHKSARNTRTGAPKKAYYVEGDNAQMGWLLGFLAEPEISRMANEYLENVVFAFFEGDSADRGPAGSIKNLIVRIVADAAERTLPDIPPEYVEEIDGMLEGCTAVNAQTRVSRERLLALNLGIDCLLAHIYSGELFKQSGYGPRMLRTPIGCNAFSLSGAAAGGRHFFGRDFMFPTADVFQDTACLIVYKPDARARGAPSPSRQLFVSQSAPGILGVMTAMNAAGVAVGVDMVPSRLCDPARPGLNSLLLIRRCMEHCASAKEAVALIAQAPRGVSWLYPVADAGGGAFVVEAGRKLDRGEPFPYFSHVPRYYRRRLPSRRFIARMRRIHGTPAPHAGQIARSNAYAYPRQFIDAWNEKLWRAFDRNLQVKLFDLIGDLFGFVADLVRGRASGMWKTLRRQIEELIRGAVWSPAYFHERGYIDRIWTAKNCPGPFYFAPQREDRPDVLLATNAFISPEMRLTSMNEWIALLAGGNLNDIQWRYDELNREILDALDAAPGGIGEEEAWKLVNFLCPNGRFPSYYNPGGTLDWRGVQVHGSVTLCELTSRTLTTLYGYYGDPPVTLHLDSFL
jgi:hypothetical protein